MIGVGFLGFGRAARYLHAPLIATVPQLRIAAIGTSRPDEARAAHPEATIHPDMPALLADPAVELVVIATPNDTHVPLGLAALAAGKHVVVDKPVALDADGATRLIDAAAAHRRLLSVYHNRRWDGDFRTVQRVLASGALGRIALAELRWDRFRPQIKPGWREADGPGTGILADLGPHLIDQALLLFGWPDALSADISRRRDGVLTDDDFEIGLSYDRLRVALSASTLVAAARPRFALHGTQAGFVKYGVDPQETVLIAGGRADVPDFGIEPPASYGRIVHGDGTSAPVPSERGEWRQFYVRMAEAILTGAPLPVPAEDARDGLRLIALARESAATGARLAVPLR